MLTSSDKSRSRSWPMQEKQTPILDDGEIAWLNEEEKDTGDPMQARQTLYSAVMDQEAQEARRAKEGRCKILFYAMNEK